MQLSHKMTKWQLFSLLTTAGTASVILPDGRPGVLSSIERESGSGSSFNLTINVNLSGFRGNVTLYVRTID